MPKGKKIAHATLDPYAINKDVPVDLAAVGDAGLTLDALLEEVDRPPPGQAARPARLGDARNPQPPRGVVGGNGAPH